jgi:response regulator NasT
MTTSLRIAVADDEALMRKYLQETLTLMGHQVVSLASNGRELVEHCLSLKPNLVITDIRMPDMDGLDAAASIYAKELVPIIVVSAYHDPDLIERAQSSHVIAYLVKPINQENLRPAIAIAMRRFQEFQETRNEAETLRQALEDRKIIERAKGLLMKRTGLDEAEAFRRLQKLASANCRKLVDIARGIVIAEEAFQRTVS